MKRIAVKGYICPSCGDGIRLSKPDVYTRCTCGRLALYGNPEDPIIIKSSYDAIESIDTILVVPDDYSYPKCGNGGVVVANPRSGVMKGLSQSQMDMIMPLLAFAKFHSWSNLKLLKALETFKEYDKIIGNS